SASSRRPKSVFPPHISKKSPSMKKFVRECSGRPFNSRNTELSLPNRRITMSEFLFLYRGGDSSGSPEEMQQTMHKWVAWMKELGESGNLKAIGNPLEPGGKVVKGKQKTITDGPYAEAKDMVGGYTLIEAKDLAEAAQLSKGCPIFEKDGFVEVRP